jgi:hypothetical protein
MADPQPWGSDPSVQWMRKVFREIERRQQDLLHRLNLSAYDQRLRPWRERALVLFENAWTRAGRQGTLLNAAQAGELYIASLSQILKTEGIAVPASSAAADASLDRLSVKEEP